MSRFDDEVARTLEALGDPAPPPPDPDPARSLIRAFLGLQMADRAAASLFDRLDESGLADPPALASADAAELTSIVATKAASAPPRWLLPLRRLAEWLATIPPDQLARTATDTLREELRLIRGIGPATADALLQAGLSRPAAVVDRASYRVLARHGWLEPTADYDEARDRVESAVGGDPARVSQLASGLSRVGAAHCKPARPRCDRCPLLPFLPASGPIEPDE
jgi:endonuclease-3 related protein